MLVNDNFYMVIRDVVGCGKYIYNIYIYKFLGLLYLYWE